MCHKLVALVYSRRMASAPQKAVLVYMADRASPDGTGVYPSVATIAGSTSLTGRTVHRAKAELVAAGLIWQTGSRRTSDGLVPVYAVNIAAVQALPSWRDDRSDAHLTESHPSPDTVSPPPCQSVTPPLTESHPSPDTVSPKPSITIIQPSFNHHNTRAGRAEDGQTKPAKPTRKRADKAAAQEAAIVAGLAGLVSEDRARAWAEHRRAKRAPMTEHAVKLMRSVLETLSERGITPDEAIDHAIGSYWTGVQVRYFDRYQPRGPDRGTNRQSRPGTGMARAFAEHAAAVAAGHFPSDPGGGPSEDWPPDDGIPF